MRRRSLRPAHREEANVRVTLGSVSGLVVAGLLLAAAGEAKTLTRSARLPAAVEKTFHASFPAGKIRRVDAEIEHGMPLYDFEFKDGAVQKEADIARDGTL